MCGIAGIVLHSNQTLFDLPERLLAMRDSMLHRGPDDAGVYVAPNGNLGLATRRLAIRDLSPAGHMPMSNPPGTVWITYNGEIYNTAELRQCLERQGYSFRSNSDTEVILYGYEAWGEKVVEHLRGMFAFAIYDARPGRDTPVVFLARDRLGVKPLYYCWTDQAFLFSSELKGIMASGLVSQEISPAGLAGYLLLGAVPSSFTIYQQTRVLEPGCTLTLQLANDDFKLPRPVRYWSLPSSLQSPCSEKDTVEQVRALLEEAVRIRLVSDVPLGAFLSGGLDSSSLVALMRKVTNGTIRTCSMVFEEASYNEASYARKVADAAGSEHYERLITAEDVTGNLELILHSLDQPSVDGVNTFFVSQTAREAGLTVALSGLGGDELFGGYSNTFVGVPVLLQIIRAVQAVPMGPHLACAITEVLSGGQRWDKIREALLRPASLASAYLARRGLFSLQEVKSLLKPEIWEAGIAGFDPVQYITERAVTTSGNAIMTRDNFNWISRAELSTYTHHQLLRDTDVMSMAHSLEVRVPFLDHELVETVLRLPSNLKTSGVGPKPLLKKAMLDLLPPVIVSRPLKQGFTFPFDTWLRGVFQDKVAEILQELPGSSFLESREVQRKLKDFQNGNLHWSRVWALVVLQGWLQTAQVPTSSLEW